MIINWTLNSNHIFNFMQTKLSIWYTLQLKQFHLPKKTTGFYTAKPVLKRVLIQPRLCLKSRSIPNGLYILPFCLYLWWNRVIPDIFLEFLSFSSLAEDTFESWDWELFNVTNGWTGLGTQIFFFPCPSNFFGIFASVLGTL